jgi:hypothetical protein
MIARPLRSIAVRVNGIYQDVRALSASRTSSSTKSAHISTLRHWEAMSRTGSQPNRPPVCKVDRGFAGSGQAAKWKRAELRLFHEVSNEMIVRRVVYLVNPPERTQMFPRSLRAFLRFSSQNQFHPTPHIIEWVGCKRFPWTRGAPVSFVHWGKYFQNKARRRDRLAIGPYARTSAALVQPHAPPHLSRPERSRPAGVSLAG